MSDFPKLGTLSVMEEGTEEEESAAEMGSLRLLNMMKEKCSPKGSKEGGLMYIDAKMAGKPITILCNTGATHNFITPDEAKRLGLKVMNRGGSIKTVNSFPNKVCGQAQGVELSLGS